MPLKDTDPITLADLAPFLRVLLISPNQATARRRLGALGIITNTDSIAEGVINLYYTDARARAAILTATITNGDTTHAPSGDAVFDAIAAEASARDAAIAAGLAGLSWKQAVRVATTAAGTLASSFENGDTVDGIVLATGNRILIKNQATGSENGIYTVNASGAPTRATDADSGAELVNATMYVSEGTVNADTQWTCTTNAPITVGSTALVFAQLSTGGGITALTGDVTASGTGSVAALIANSAVTLAKIANAAASSKLLGSGASGSGAPYSEITLGSGLVMTGTTLSAPGSVAQYPPRWNQTDRGGPSVTVSDFALKAAIPANSAWLGVRAARSLEGNGFWYWEWFVNTYSANMMLGLASSDLNILTDFAGFLSNSYAVYGSNGQKYNNNAGTAYFGSAYAASDVIGCAFKVVAGSGSIWFHKNGVYPSSGDPAAGTNAAFTGIASNIWFPTFSANQSSAVTLRPTTGSFGYTAPTGASPYGA